jgi:uncharacterized membrane protein YkoI
MSIRRIATLTALALLLAGTVGFTSSRALAQQGQPTATPQVQSQVATEIQSGNQVEDGKPDSSSEIAGAEAPEAASEAETSDEALGAADAGPDVREPSYTGSIAISPDQNSGLSESDEAAVLQAKAVITPAEAESAALAANAGANVVKTELDNENGALVYSVELSSGADVKVDAGSGTILHTDVGGNYEG